MIWLTEYKLHKLDKKAVPSPEFKSRLEFRLRSELGLKPAGFPVWKLATVSAMVLVVAASGTGAYAYTSPDVLPDTPLYGVRLALENIEEHVAILPNWRAKVVIKHLKKRISENEILKQKNKPISDERVRMFSENLRQAIDKTESLDASEEKTTDEALDELEIQHEDVLLGPKNGTTTSDEKKLLEKTLKQEREKTKERIQKMDEKRRGHFKRILERENQKLNRK